VLRARDSPNQEQAFRVPRLPWPTFKRKDIEVTIRIFSATFSHSHCPLLCSADTKRGAIMHYGKNDSFHIVAARGRRSVDC
jgi:hypothetical protein